jgi:Ca2+-binding RTX toxin-like protein
MLDFWLTMTLFASSNRRCRGRLRAIGLTEELGNGTVNIVTETKVALTDVNITGTAGNDTLSALGHVRGVVFDAGEGNNTLVGGNGDDVLKGDEALDQATSRSYSDEGAAVSSGPTTNTYTNFDSDAGSPTAV